MKDPNDIVVCRKCRQLYVADYNSCIWRVSVDSQSYIKWLPTGSSTDKFHVDTLSVTSRGLLVTSFDPPHLREYSMTDGQQLRVVDIPGYMSLLYHGVETTRGTFVISHVGTSQNKLWAVSELFSCYNINYIVLILIV